MKVLLVSPNVESLPDPVFPLGLAYITSVLKENGIQNHVLDLCFVQGYEAAIESAINPFQPDIIGLSLRNLDNVSYPNYISYLPFYRQVVQTIRRLSKGLIVLGGSAFALMPGSILEYLSADFGIVGEGELSFVRLINHIEGEKDYYQGLGSRIIDDHEGIIENLDALPIPDRSGFDNQAYLKWGGMGNIQTKRGCPFRCIYCTYPIVEGEKVRLRSPRLICDEVECMLANGIKNLFFVDNIFNYPINQDMLDNLGKNFTVDDLREASAICQQSGISFCHSLLLGGPGETMETVHQTLDLIRDMSPTAVICMIGIRVFPKTRLSLIAMEEGVIGPKEDFLKPVFYLSSAIENEILPFIEKFSKENPTWIFPGLNININVELQKKLRRFGVKGPLWEYMKTGERFRKKVQY
jgi:radical SAM superfamily enzyme YgiQ (UPF0313 family)